MTPKAKSHKHQWAKKEIRDGSRKIVGYVCTYKFKDPERGDIYCPAKDYVDLIQVKAP